MSRLFLLLLSCFLLSSCDSALMPYQHMHKAKELPNIILLIGDDQGYPYFGFMGASYLETPNMDTLAASGTLFTQGYVPANHCRPSLATLLTGILPTEYQLQEKFYRERERKKEPYQSLTKDEQENWEQNFNFQAMQYFETLPKLLAKQGYVSFQGGKWWEFNYQNGGFTEGMTKGWTAEDRKNGGQWFKQFMGGEGLQLGRGGMQAAYDFMDHHKDQPFFLWYAPELPHYPFNAPAKYYDRYRDKEMTESAKRYYANCTWFDDGVGELIRYLKQVGEFEETLLIYVNDNGWEQEPDQEFRQDSLRWHNGGDKGKLSMYDQSFRTPIIFSWANQIKAGRSQPDLIHSADIPATILDYVGLPVPEYYFGQSYKAVIEGKKAGPRKEIIGNIDQIRWEGDMMGRRLDGYWLRNANWFFNWNQSDGIQSLYNMQLDPRNEDNVAAEYPQQVEAFKTKIEQWRQSQQITRLIPGHSSTE